MERLPESCTEYQALLPLFVGSDLDPREQDAVDLHLKDCFECHALAQRGESARLALTAQAQLDEGFDESRLWEGIRMQLQSDGFLEPVSRAADAVPARPRLSLVPNTWRQWGGRAAAAALVITLGVLQFGGPGDSPARVDTAPDSVAETAVDATPMTITPALEASPVALRRAQPGDERMIESAQPYQEALFAPTGGATSGATLVGGSESSTSTLMRPTRVRRIR